MINIKNSVSEEVIGRKGREVKNKEIIKWKFYWAWKKMYYAGGKKSWNQKIKNTCCAPEVFILKIYHLKISWWYFYSSRKRKTQINFKRFSKTSNSRNDRLGYQPWLLK